MNKIVSIEEERDRARRRALRAALPDPATKRWVARRKAAVVAALDGGAITETEAMARYEISAEELGAWRRSLSRHGVSALFATRLQIYRGEGEQ